MTTARATMQLRPYQVQSIEAVRRDWHEVNSTLLVSATGSGKTVVFLEILLGGHGHEGVLTSGKRGILLVHRDELARQPLERIAQYWPEWLLRVGVVKAEQNQCGAQLVIASVASLYQDRRLAQLLAYGPIDYIVIDEAHHVVATTYRKIIDTLKTANPNLKVLGVTATPKRADDVGLIEVFERVSAKYGIKELVPQYLVPPRWLGVATRISVAKVQSSNGDFVAKQLAHVFETDNCFDLVVETHRKYADGRRAMAFTVSVAGAYALASKFNEKGIPAAAIDGTTPREQRRQILRDFHTGKYQVICNMGVLTEGFDCPDVSCIHMVRPTRSDSLYLQIVGRALRTCAGKSDALILDYSPAETRNLAMLGDLLGAPRKAFMVKEPEEAEEGEIVGGFTFDGQLKGLRGNPLELVARQLDYLDGSAFLWDRRDDWLILSLGKNGVGVDRMLALTPPRTDRPHTLYLLSKPRDSWDWGVEPLAEHDDFGELSDQANAYAEQHAVVALASKEAFWLKQPASENQLRFLKKLAGKEKLPPVLTKGEASRLIACLQARQVLQQHGLWL